MPAEMSFVSFRTETVLDVRAITTFGLNAKPNTKSPIGYFGTGLKMAIAVLLRHHVPVTLYIDGTEYEFYLKEDDFRGTSYQQVMMKKRGWGVSKWFATPLPFTTELAKNWALWQAYRELESNTRDENGTSIAYALRNPEYWPAKGVTEFIIGPSIDFAQVHIEQDKYFLPNALREYEYGDATIQIFRQPSNAVYYRGIRIFDLAKPSLFTYNVLAPIELTEDRTAKYEWALKSKVQDFLARSEDRGLINHLLNATDKHWENSLDWDDSIFATAPSAVFKGVLASRVVREQRKKVGYVPISSRFAAYHERHTPKPPEPSKPSLSERFTGWLNEGAKMSHLLPSEIDAFEELVAELRQVENT